jgi:GNAT superfamily N-acetyltransferase
MAVDAAWQRQGLGRMLLDELARRSRIEGEQLLWADARDSAVEFYLRIGARQSPTPPDIDEITGLVGYRIIFEL